MNNHLKKIVLLIGDIYILYFSLYLALLIRYWALPTGRLWQDHFSPFTLLFIALILLFYIANLYDFRLVSKSNLFLQLLAKTLAISAGLAITFFYLNPGINIAPKRNLFIFLLIFAVLFFIWRQLFNYLLKSYLPKNIIGIVGYNSQVLDLIKEIHDKPGLGYQLAFIIDDNQNTDIPSFNIPIFSDIKNLDSLIAKSKASALVLTSDPHQSQDLRTALFTCLHLHISFISLPKFYEQVTGKVPVDAINQMWFLENLSEGDKGLFDLFKRIYDLVLALCIFLITLPFWLIISLLVKYDSPGPVFFTQVRVGQHGKIFKIYKFRSMTTNGNNFAPTANHDRRITRFGQFMRKTRIDELPQTINILKGEMSFVGPRPERPELIKELEKNIPFYRERMLVKPGVTGWDQVSGEYHSPSYEDTMKKLQFDLFYIKNRSIYLDISILLKTVATIVARGGV
jgi:exopolysaccharide biosynthesis polyprenyl glycosylphosphotransferase